MHCLSIIHRTGVNALNHCCNLPLSPSNLKSPSEEDIVISWSYSHLTIFINTVFISIVHLWVWLWFFLGLVKTETLFPSSGCAGLPGIQVKRTHFALLWSVLFLLCLELWPIWLSLLRFSISVSWWGHWNSEAVQEVCHVTEEELDHLLEGCKICNIYQKI